MHLCCELKTLSFRLKHLNRALCVSAVLHRVPALWKLVLILHGVLSLWGFVSVFLRFLGLQGLANKVNGFMLNHQSKTPSPSPHFKPHNKSMMYHVHLPWKKRSSLSLPWIVSSHSCSCFHCAIVPCQKRKCNPDDGGYSQRVSRICAKCGESWDFKSIELIPAKKDSQWKFDMKSGPACECKALFMPVKLNK